MSRPVSPVPFTADQTHGVALRPANRLVAHSEALGWRSLYADVTIEAAYRDDLPEVDDVALGYVIRGRARYAARVDGGAFAGVYSPRQIGIIPPGAPARFEIQGALENLHIYVRRVLLDRMLQETFGQDSGRVLITPRFTVADPLLEQLALGVHRAMVERPPGHALYVDCLTQALAAHLVQNYSTLARRAHAPKLDTLTDHRLRRLADYIEAHLGDDLALDTMAEVAGMSPYHLAHSFSAAFGQAPHAYVMTRRVAHAKELLRATDLPVTELALTCGFASPQHMATVFKRALGVTPSAYRRGLT